VHLLGHLLGHLPHRYSVPDHEYGLWPVIYSVRPVIYAVWLPSPEISQWGPRTPRLGGLCCCCGPAASHLLLCMRHLSDSFILYDGSCIRPIGAAVLVMPHTPFSYFHVLRSSFFVLCSSFLPQTFHRQMNQRMPPAYESTSRPTSRVDVTCYT
jgi:hypothetical protein